MATESLNVGVLAIHGGVIEHVESLKKAAVKLSENGKPNVKVRVLEIRTPEQVNDELDGLILPGGESTVLTQHLSKGGFLDLLKDWTRRPSKFTWGTCAGLIMLCNKVSGDGGSAVAAIGGLDVTCVRNAFGRQINSFEGDLLLTDSSLSQSTPNCLGVFIRAPGIKSLDSDDVTVLCRLPGDAGHALSDAVGVRQNNVMGCSFHPELTGDTRWHEYFLNEALKRKQEK